MKQQPITSMKNKVCIVTGSNSGTGYVSALELAKAGATVIMLCRNSERGKTAQNEIIKLSGNKNVDLIVADLSDLEQVKNAVSTFKSKYDRLDVLLNNAGGIVEQRRVTPQGLEESFAANYLGPFLLTQLLLDTLIKSAPSRIIDVSSIANMYGKIDFDDLQKTKKYAYRKAYSQAKLAQLMASFELAGHIKNTGVTVNALQFVLWEWLIFQRSNYMRLIQLWQNIIFHLRQLWSDIIFYAAGRKKNGVLDTCNKLGISVIPYAPLAEGILTGKYRSGEKKVPLGYTVATYFGHLNLTKERNDSASFLHRLFSKPMEIDKKKIEPLFIEMDKIAATHGKTLAQVAINWLLTNEEVSVIPIPGVKNIKQVIDNIGAMTLENHQRRTVAN